MTDPFLEADIRDEFDRPLGGLTGNRRTRFDHTQIEGAAVEVRFLPVKAELTEADAVHVWKEMDTEALPVFERQAMNVVNLTLKPTGHDQSHEVQQGWVMASADRRTAISLYPSVVAVQTANYDHYSPSLGEPLSKALRLFVEATGASVVQRIGLRYVNRLHNPEATTPTYWSARVRPAFAGPLSQGIAPLVEALHQQVQLKLDDTAASRIQSGVFREQTLESRYSFLVDLDVFREEAMNFDERLCANLTRQLNRTALALFTHVLSEEYLADMGPVPFEEDSQ